MWAQFSKEIRGFLSGFTGYVVIIVFLVANSLFLWVLGSSPLNIMEKGYASLEPLFIMAPWVFLFLIPAITMRIFAEEHRSGTLELLLTRPLTDMQVILSKYLATLVLIVISLLPSLFWYWSVGTLGSPPWDIDKGATWGSYTGLLFLSGIYAAVGLFISATTSNQIVSFILSVVFCFMLYSGFDYVSSAGVLGSLGKLLIRLGINDHYTSMSRGVLDTRDIVYFLSLISLFLMGTQYILQRRNWTN